MKYGKGELGRTGCDYAVELAGGECDLGLYLVGLIIVEAVGESGAGS